MTERRPGEYEEPVNRERFQHLEPYCLDGTADDVARRAEQQEAKQGTAATVLPPAPHTLSRQPTTGNVIEEYRDIYRLYQVPYRQGFYTIDWSKMLLHNGGEKKLEDWVAVTRNEIWTLPDLPLWYATLRHLYHNHEHPVPLQRYLVHQMSRVFIAYSDGQRNLLVSTRIHHQPGQHQTIIHHCGYADQYQQVADLKGPDGQINATSGMRTALEALLGTSDGAEVEAVVEGITLKKPYLLRFAHALTREDEFVGLLSSTENFNIYTNINLNSPRSALGVNIHHTTENA